MSTGSTESEAGALPVSEPEAGALLVNDPEAGALTVSECGSADNLIGQRRLTLLDTTLRDGEQRAGVALTLKDKLGIVRRLDEIGIHYIEAGYPASNDRDRELFEHLAAEPLANSTVVAFGSTRHKNTSVEQDPGLAALAACPASVVSIVGKASVDHVEKVLETTLDENLAMVADTIGFLVKSGKRVFFDAEHYFDGYLDNPQYAIQVLLTAVTAGTELLVLCDTNGGMLPHQVFEICLTTRQVLFDALGEDRMVDIGIHCHNDSGVAVANSLEAVRAGCVQAQGTINGYGERVGNADILIILADLQLKMGYQLVSDQQLARLTELTHSIAAIMNIAVDAHQPYSGSNAFAHKAGLHSASITRHKPSYEHVDPLVVGNFSRIVISELSGRSALAQKANELGIELPGSSSDLADLLNKVKEREGKGFSYEVAEASLALFLADLTGRAEKCFELESFRVLTEKHEDGRAISEATIKLSVAGERVVTTGEGVGPVNALDAALRMAITRFYPEVKNFELTDYKVRVLDESTGTSAVTRVLIDTSDGSRSWGTVGVSENIIEASW
ncbi:MAG: citramalate synthase, partial [Coriobacteriales bacterium]|nr:citramalate synthase [Coriobacteriales bacterium]